MLQVDPGAGHAHQASRVGDDPVAQEVVCVGIVVDEDTLGPSEGQPIEKDADPADHTLC